ncbi:MAG: hypothetical protein HY690_13620 [Chloroflexi bacterium]|nr:hypothetical protein [Chloroflexota bacterium]
MEERSYNCGALNGDGTLCGRPATLPDPRNGGLLCELHAWERWRGGEDLAAVLEAIGRASVPRLPAVRSLMWVMSESPVLALSIIVSGYAAMIGSIEEALMARDPELAQELLSLGSRAMAGVMAARLMEVPVERREMLMGQSGLGKFLENYRTLMEQEEGR